MPIYNGYEYIDESIQSIKEQTYKDWELIIGINGHSLNSEIYYLAKQYENDKIKVIDLDVKGKSKTLNILLQYCKYSYIALIDVDDIWYPNKLQYQSVFMDEYDIIGTNCIYFGDLNHSPNIPMYDLKNFDMKICNPIINSSVIIRKELCEWDETMNILEDYDLWIKLRYKKIYNCPDILVKHRIHKSSEFNTKTTYEDIHKLLNKYNIM